MRFAFGTAVAMILFGVLLSGVAGWRRVRGLSLEACRKITHVGMGLACLSFPLFVSTAWQAISLAVLFTAVLALLRLKPDLLWGGGELLPASRCESEGEFYFVAGAAFAVLFAREDRFVYLASMLMLTFADAAAALVGQWTGRLRCWGNDKTMEGSLAFCLVALLCLLGPCFVMEHGGDLGLILAICLLATVSEGISARGSDNLWIPVVCVAGLQLPRWVPPPFEVVAVFATTAALLGCVVFRKSRASGAGAGSRSLRCDADRPECVSPPARRPLQAATAPDEAR